MSFLKKSFEDQDSEDDSLAEEQYERLFPKIGRDFVYAEDFVSVIRKILAIIDPAGVHKINPSSNDLAIRKAQEYKEVIDSGLDGSERYQDLVEFKD